MFEFYELILYLLGRDQDIEIDIEQLEGELYVKYEITMAGFEDLIHDLMPLCMASESTYQTGTYFRGFADPKARIYLAKRKVDEKN